MRVRRPVLGVVALVAGVALAGCGSDAPSSPAGPDGAEASSAAPAPPDPPGAGLPSAGLPDLDVSPTLQRIRERGRLQIAVRRGDPIAAVRDPKTGQYAGFDVAIARIVAAGLGLNPQDGVTVKPMSAESARSAVSSGDIDLQFGVTDAAAARASGAAMSRPYALVGSPGQRQARAVALAGQDRVLREKINGILRRAVRDGSWQRAYDRSLGREGIPATPPH